MGPEGRSRRAGLWAFVAQVTVVQPLEFPSTPGINTMHWSSAPWWWPGVPFPRQGTEAGGRVRHLVPACCNPGSHSSSCPALPFPWGLAGEKETWPL